MRRGYGALAIALVIFAPVGLAFYVLKALCLIVRALYRTTYGKRRAMRKRAESAIQLHQTAPQRARLAATERANRDAARAAANAAIARGDVKALESAWRALDANGGDYR